MSDISTLQALQEDFQDFILRGNDTFAEKIQGKDSAHALSRANIYANMYAERLLEVLALEYAGFAALVGEDSFIDLVYDYIDSKPSQSPVLRDFCNDFLSFIQTHEKYQGQALWQDMAAFEKAISDCTEAPARSIKTKAHLQSISQKKWPRLCFEFHPSLRVLETCWNIAELWTAQQAGEALPEAVCDQDNKTCLVIWRYQIHPQFLALDMQERWMFLECYAGKQFAEVCSSLCEIMPEQAVPTTAVGYLVKWLDAGWIVNIRV